MRPRRVGMLDDIDNALEWPFAPPDQRSLITTTSEDIMFWGRSVRLPMFLDADPFKGVFSFCEGEPVLYMADLVRSMIPPATGILVGDGVLGDELILKPLRPSGVVSGELVKVACAMRDFKSDRELLRFFFNVFASFLLSSGGGEAPIVLNLETAGPCELDGRSSNAPSTVGLSRDMGRLGDSMDFDRVTDPFDKLEETNGSPVATFRFDLLSVRQTEGRSPSPLLFCRNKVSAKRFRKDEVFEATDPVAEAFCLAPDREPKAELLPVPNEVTAPGPISSKSRSWSSTILSSKLMYSCGSPSITSNSAKDAVNAPRSPSLPQPSRRSASNLMIAMKALLFCGAISANTILTKSAKSLG